MNDWKLEITKCDNGYLLSGITINNETGEDIDVDFVIEDTDDELESHEKLLWEVMNYFGFRGSKHGTRIRIIRENNDG